MGMKCYVFGSLGGILLVIITKFVFLRNNVGLSIKEIQGSFGWSIVLNPLKVFVFSDDLWVVSKTLDFELDTFIACSAFFGPSSINEVELLPLKGYFPSNWPTNSKYYYAHINLY